MSLTSTIPVSLTPSAIAELKSIQQLDQIEKGQMLRIGVKGGGCSGLTYVLDFDHKQEFDDVFEIDGLSFLVDQRHSLYLFGMEVDYQDGLNDRGFIFNNPNATSTCGCGTSFAT